MKVFKLSQLDVIDYDVQYLIAGRKWAIQDGLSTYYGLWTEQDGLKALEKQKTRTFRKDVND